MLIYLHGFNSAPASHKATVLKRFMQERGLADLYACPALSHRPPEAIRAIEQEIARHPRESVSLIGSSLGGTVLVELIFNWPGLSSYLVTGINQRDYPVVQAVVLVIATLFILLNLVTDLAYAVIDPRIRYG